MDNVRFVVSGVESIDQDFKKVQAEIKTSIAKAMPQLADAMKQSLKEHIDQDVYAAYTPQAYPRRSENPGFGVPLNDIDSNTFVDTWPDGVRLDYKPDGSHSGTKRDLKGGFAQDSIRPIKPNPVHGDDLVRRIETGQGYDWDFSMARPFFQNFVWEMVEGGGAAAELITALNMVDPTLEATEDGTGAVRDGNEWQG